jgi:hypothetical protein
MVFECDAYESVREQFWYLFDDFGDWVSPRDTVRPDERCLARFMQQRQSRFVAERCCLRSLLFGPHEPCLAPCGWASGPTLVIW